MSNTLYEIDAMFQACIDEINIYADEHGDEVDPCLTQKLDALSMVRDAKIEQCLRYLKNRLSERDAIGFEIMKLQKRMDTITRDAEYMKSYIGASVGAGIKMSFPVGVISWRKSVSTEIVDAAAIPAQFRHQKIEETISKTEIKEAINAGQDVPGAKLVEKQNIQIK
jgi:hypothetical protein